jgi:hypothetical protein
MNHINYQVTWTISYIYLLRIPVKMQEFVDPEREDAKPTIEEALLCVQSSFVAINISQ